MSFRQRRVTTNSHPEMCKRNEGPHRPSTGLSCPSLLQASPQEHGLAYKLHVPFVYAILPRRLQSLITRISFLARYLAPQWKKRYLVLLGSYLYKFVDNTSHTDPKGSPIPVDSIDAHLVELKQETVSPVQGLFIDTKSMPENCQAVLCVATFQKVQYFAVADREQATTWLNALSQAKQEAIQRTMGHAPVDSYPSHWSYYDRLGEGLCKQKERIRRRLHEASMREMEMIQVGDASSFPRGYFG